MTEDRAPKVADEPTSTARQRPERKKRKWDQPAEDLVSAAATSAAVAGLPLMNISALPGVALASPAAIATPTLPSVVPVRYALPPQIPPSVLQNAAAVVQKLSQAKLPDEIIAREVVINDADPSVRYKLTKRQTQEEIQRCTNTIIITRGKYKPPNGQPNDEKPLYLHISAGSQLKDTAERIKAVDRAASMIEEIMKQGQIPETASVPVLSGCGQAVHPFSASVFLGFDADPLLNVAARIRGPNDQYINHIMNETGVTVVLRGKGSGNLGSFQGEASQQPLHLYLSGMHLKNLEAAKVLAENLLDTIAAEFGAFRISSSKVYGSVPPPQQLLTGVHTSGTVSDSDVHSTLEPNVLTGASHSFASSGIAASLIAPSEALQSRAPTYVGALPPCNVTCPAPPVNGGAFYSGYGNIYPQATPLQQVASTLKHSISLTTQVVPVTTTLTSTAINATSSSDLETDKRSQRRKFQELPVSKGPTAEFQNSQQGSEFVKTGLSKFGNVRSSSIAHPNKVQTGSDGMLPSNQVDIPSHLSASNEMAPPPSNIMMPPPSRNMLSPLPHRSMPPPPPQMSMPPPPPKFPSGEMMPKKANMSLVSPEPVVPPRSLNTRSVLPPKLCAQLPAKEPSDRKPNVAPVSDTLLRLMDYGDEDDDDI